MTEERIKPGHVLRLEREKKGLSVGQVASQLRLSPAQVEALETDDYGSLPGNVFVRGFIRNYAKLLQIDASSLLEAIDPPKESIEPPKDEGIPFPSGRKRSWVHYAIAFVLLAFLALVYEMYRENHVQKMPLPKAVQPAVKPVQPASVPEPVSAPLSMPAPHPLSSPIPVSAPQGASSPAASGPIHLYFDAASWVEISDSSGRLVFSKLSPAGSDQSVAGSAPFMLTIGNARHVRLSYEGRPVDLSPYIKAEVAHLTLR